MAEWRVALTGNQCQCAGCHEVFTTPRAFDSHQTMHGGELSCQDPRRMFDGKHRRKLVLTVRGWAKNPELSGYNTFNREARNVPKAL